MRLRYPKSPVRAVREAGRTSQARALIGLAATLWLAVAGIAAFFLYVERQDALERATRNAEALVRLLDAHTARTFEAVDITLAGVADALQLAPDRPGNDPAFQRALTERLEALQPYARAIFVVRPDGSIAHSTHYPAVPGVSVFDRSYFQAHLNDPAPKGAVSGPLRSRSGLGWFLPVTRPLRVNGQFRGVVVASLQPQYFELLFSRLGLGNPDAVTLHHRDGTLIARYPHREDHIGKSFAATALFARHLPRAAAGSYFTDSGVFSYERVVSYRTLSDVPLVVAMGRSTASILEPWRATALGAAVALAALLLLLAGLVAQFLRHQRMRELARERRMQSEKLEALGHLTGGVSHDFANLLNVVSASFRAIATEPGDARRVREAVAAGERAVLRGTQLIGQLRAFARRQPLHVQPADLNLLIRAGSQLLRQVTGEEMKMEIRYAADLPRCLVDETELEVALVNLLVNSRDAGARRVVLRTYDSSSHVCLSVSDDGAGMSDDARRRVLDPYFTTKGEAGTGLGLAQVYGFLRQIGGDVRIDSRPGKGTAVHLMFARAPAGNAASQPAEALSQYAVPPRSTGGYGLASSSRRENP